jgi:probable phosphoglycerate mutase
MSLHLYLIRHGETEWAISSRHTGHSDIPLTANGKDEARRLGPQLQGISFAHVLTSPLKRARLTCKLVALNGVPEIEPDLVEWNYGDYEGEKSVNIRRKRPDWDVFRDGCPNGEMPAQVLARAERLIARLRKLDGNVALFSHGQFGGVLGARWIGMPLENARHFPLGTASVSILAYDPDHPEVPVISLWNYLLHPFSVQPPPSGQTMKQRAIQRWENEGGEIPVEKQKTGDVIKVPASML